MDRDADLWHPALAMSKHPIMNPSRRAAARLLVVSLAWVSGFACKREVSAAEIRDNSNPSAVVAEAVSSAPASRFDEAAFSLTIDPQGTYAVGRAASVAIHLTAKGPHHVNQEYPHKLKLKATDGVTYPQTVISRDAMKITNEQADFIVALTPSRSGRVTVGGDFAFSLCTADRCLIEKRALALDVQVQ